MGVLWRTAESIKVTRVMIFYPMNEEKARYYLDNKKRFVIENYN